MNRCDIYRLVLVIALAVNGLATTIVAQEVTTTSVPGQPLAQNVRRLLEALDYLGEPLPPSTTQKLTQAIKAEDSAALQELLDPAALAIISINPEQRVKVARGPAAARLQQAGYRPVLLKILNDAAAAPRLRISSPQAGPVYAGTVEQILRRQAQTELKINENVNREHRFLDVELFDKSPMTARLSGLAVEYVVALIYSSEAGQREATLVFDIGQGTQDLGFRSELPVLFTIDPAVPVRLAIHDFDGQPTTARLEFRDRDGHVYPPQAKRLAPDFFFQPQVYRADGDTILLPPGELELIAGRGPEYLNERQTIRVSSTETNTIAVALKRWVQPAAFGYYCGDHHIHAAGCSHYDNPTEGVTPRDMFAQVKGEGLNVGCVLTWGPCFDHQRTFFSPEADYISEPWTVLKYDLEISGFGSASLGHVCLLNLRDQTYPNSAGTSTQGWPTWTVPVMRWAKEQGGITGYPHSALSVDPRQTAEWLLATRDASDDEMLSREESARALLPESFDDVDRDHNGSLSRRELEEAANRAADQLPNLAIPALDGGGAMEIFVSTAEGVCDFISAMDTARIPEWNTWYHLLNCGFPLKLSGETDFPCMSSRRVGQGRVYVQLGQIEHVSFANWCAGVAAGRSYISDGYAHALKFAVNGQTPGQGDVTLSQPGQVQVRAVVAFAAEQPTAVAYGTLQPAEGRRMVGDTVTLHAPRDSGTTRGGTRLVEIVVNGQVRYQVEVPADGQTHELKCDLDVPESSWIALRQFPQLHTNPVNVLVEQAPIRASRGSAVWCAESVRRLWHTRHRFIAEPERPAARAAYESAVSRYLQIAAEARDDGTYVPDTLKLLD
ncbi:MAG: CehA/McbA family metallohydrolase [Planctomycetales bacterium]|nr:CehA/McbA family metallohydrolase [Planctomycetales bacterium]